MVEYAGISSWHGRKVFTLATKKNIAAMKKAAFVVENYIKTHFTLAGTGRMVRRTKDSKYHRASRPGQPPAIDYGSLQSSIQSEVRVSGLEVVGKVGSDVQKLASEAKKRQKGTARAHIGSELDYGLYLELGTRRMKARPFLRPALRATRRAVNAIFRKANKI